jgi:outer membrane receptor protein involved in Fe transport
MRCVALSAFRLLSFALLLLFAVASLSAQTNNGAIAGTILDSSGGVVADAAVEATGVGTNTVYNTVSSSTGAYRFSNMVLGSYNIKVTSPGFKVAELTGVVVEVNTTASLDITLQPGNVKETLTVVADAPRIQTESSEVGTVVTTRQIQDLPFSIAATGQSFLRSPETFVFLAPGTTGPGTNQNGSSSAGIFQSKLTGGQNFGTEVLLDGVSTTRADSGSAFDQTAPSVEALQEFKVQTSTFSSQFGRTSGGVESFSTKSGSNSFHGGAFDLLRNDKLDANSWGNNAQGFPKPRDHQNDFGVTLGGPVWIPKVYNGRDKTFFFFSWEQYRNNQGTSSTSYVPTDGERGGDFSDVLGAPLKDADGNPVLNPCDGTPLIQGQIFDPATTQTVIVGGKQVTCRTAFPGNKITSALDPVALNVLSYFDVHPNMPLNGDKQNFVFLSNKPVRDETMTIRIDHNLGTRDKLYFSYSDRDQSQLNGNPTLPGILDPNFFNTNTTHYLRFGWDHTLNTTLVNSFVIGLNRLNNLSKGMSANGTPDWPALLGISNAHGPIFPPFSFNDSPTGFGYQGLSAGNFDGHVPNSLVTSDNVSWVIGRHSFNFGFEWRAYQYSALPIGNTSPQYTFENFQTAYTPNNNQTGDPFASFLLGLPNKELLTVSKAYPRLNSNYYAAYVQDDYKFRKDLTLNLGLRYDIDTPRYEAHQAQSNLDLTIPNPGAPGEMGALIYGPQASLGHTYFKDFGPRIGLAYAPEALFGRIHNLVIRAAYGIYYAPIVYDDLPTGSIQFSDGSTANPNFQSQDNFTSVQKLSDGFPAYLPPTNSTDPNRLNGQNVGYIAPKYGRPGMTQNWTFEIQKQLAQDLILSIGYVGIKADHLHTNIAQVNALGPQYYHYGQALNDSVTSPEGQAILTSLGVTVPTWFTDLYGTGAPIGQLLRPYPQFLDVGGSNNNMCSCLENLGISTYNAFQAKLERRFRNGLNLLASYTYSKTLTNADSAFPVFSGFQTNEFAAQNPFNPKSQKALSYQDTPHVFVLSYLYELPAGPGKKHFNQGIAAKVLGGWQVGGILRYQNGSPTVLNTYATSAPFTDGSFRISVNPGVPVLDAHHSSFNPDLSTGCGENADGSYFPYGTNNYFNCAAFYDPNPDSLVAQRGYVYGNAPLMLGNARSQNYFNEDFSIVKRTTIWESHTIIFKVDIPNAFNRHVFNSLNGAVFSWNNSLGKPNGYPGSAVISPVRQIQFTVRYQF